MNIPNLAIFTALLNWIENGTTAWLCTVTETWGSSPRPQGSLMAVNDQGEQIGSLSGGCIEEALIEYLQTQSIATTQHIIYGETVEEAERLQLPCGGTVGVLIELITAKQVEHLHTLINSLQSGQTICRDVDFRQNCYEVQSSQQPFAYRQDENGPVRLSHCIGPQRDIFLIGVSDVAVAIAELAQWMGYHIIVCDPRSEKLHDWPLQNCTLLSMLPDEGLQQYANNTDLTVLALTHDPRIDDMGLLAAFDTQACYIGAMGSLKTSQKRRERLLQLGITHEQLQRLDAPVGLDIGSKTPREIAVAIMAKLVKLDRANTR